MLSAPDSGSSVRVLVLAGDIVLCSWARHLTLSNAGVTLRWTGIPSKGSRNSPSHSVLQKPKPEDC